MEHTPEDTIANYTVALEKRLNEIRRLEGINASLLKALENIMPLAQTGFSAMSRRDQTKNQQAILRAARAAIKDAKGDA